MSIPKRSEVPAEHTWDVSHIFADESAWQEAFEKLGAYGNEIAVFTGTLGSSAATLLKWFRLQDEIELLAGKVYGYASLCSDVDTADSHFQAMRGKAMSALVGISGAGAFAGMNRLKAGRHLLRDTERKPHRNIGLMIDRILCRQHILYRPFERRVRHRERGFNIVPDAFL